ncbi:hypothetical protein B0T22DRAFT_81734 [Podospora appendiculata]|uniref:RNA-binding protein n=1 Tax=Podospora appendiculata TaxID=314037 RepID=A0AAE0XJW2_9PEZI|nr:hypothetical protein B0T22DRAFT_81734 [Podospora appendiculata]
MYDGYRSASRDGGANFRRSPPRRPDDRDDEYYRPRKDHPSPPPRSLNYDDVDNDDTVDRDHHHHQQHHFARGSRGGRYGTAHANSDPYAGGHYDADAAGHHSGAGGFRDGYPASRSNPTAPGKAIVLEDVPDDATERDILYGLDYVTRDRHMSTDQVRVARLRHDHNGRRTALVEFHRRADAEYFMDNYYPEISFPLEHTRGIGSEPVTFGIDYGRSRDEADSSRDPRRDDDGWDCLNCGVVNYPHRAVCYKCKSERLAGGDDSHGRGYGFSSFGPLLTGETDECPQQLPSQYLVVRDLEGSVTEDLLAKGVMKLFVDESSGPAKEPSGSTNKLKSTAPTNSTAGLGAKPGSLRRVFLMRDRKSNESWRYGFAEFATVEDAKAAVAKFRAAARFTIASKPVFVAFIHTGVFVPSFDAAPGENPNFSFTPIYNPALRLKYWDERAYPSVLVVSTDPLSGPPSPEKAAAGGDAADKSASNRLSSARKAKKDKEAAAANKAIAMMPQMQMWAKKSAELHGAKKSAGLDGLQSEDRAESLASASIRLGEADDLQPDGPSHPHWTDQYRSYADWDRVACLLCNWEVPSEQALGDNGYAQCSRKDVLIDHEVRVHNHYKDNEAKEKASTLLAALAKEPRTITRRTPRLKSEAPPVYISYSDFDALHCHLCRRTFKHAQTIWRHEQESELHKHMLSDPRNKERAVAELKAKDKVPSIMVPDSKTRQQQPHYRDRALERRQVFRQPNRPAAQSAKGTAEKRKEPSTSTVEADETPAKKSRGAGMLAKMGWTAGAGLGAEGTGRTEAIATDAYAPGVGLGAEGGKLGDASEEAARKTRGNFSDFIEKTRDKARERYDRL